MAYHRKLQFDIGAGGIGLRISDLQMSFNVERHVDLSSNSAQFIIYNAKEQTRKEILKNGNNIIFKAGYEDENTFFGTVFIGTVISSRSYKAGSDWITEIEGGDIGNNQQKLTYQIVSLSYVSRTPLSLIILDVVSILNVPVFGIENVTTILNNGFVYSGTIGGAIKKIKQILNTNDVNLYFDNGEMVIYRLGDQNSRFGIVRLTQKNGLVGTPQDITDEDKQDDKKRISFSSLLNAKIKPNTIININSNTINGTFIVEKANFIGDNFGGDFLCNGEAIE